MGEYAAMKHTPGPWTFAWSGSHALIFPLGGGATICGVPYDTEEDAQQAEANAQLIAAAPETADALEKLQAELEAMTASRDELQAMNFKQHDTLAADAARYQFMKSLSRATSVTSDGMHSWTCQILRLDVKGPTLDAAIDAAILMEGDRNGME